MYGAECNAAWPIDDRRLASFWSHHRALLRWLEAHQKARDCTVSCCLPSGSARSQSNAREQPEAIQTRQDMTLVKKNSPLRGAQNSSSDPLPDVERELLSENTDGDIDISTEMAAFFRQTIEHRKQREANRSKKIYKGKEENHWLETEEDDYIMADRIGVYGCEKRSLRLPDQLTQRQKKQHEMRNLYGSDAEKIMAMETHLDLWFEQNYSQPGAHFWPNIPLKL